MKKTLFTLTAVMLGLVLSSWGYKGHYKINQNMAVSIPEGLSFLKPDWTLSVTFHCSDADNRKDTDPDESARHYIDIDNYTEFVQNGFISPCFDTVVLQHGLAWVIDQGILPWATLATFDSLRAAFQRGDWNQSALFAADLGHYVGDGHMPLHITRNYNGQYTGQTGVHSRYESKMISRYDNQIVYTPDSAILINDVRGFVFSYLYNNYLYKDSILLADQYSYTVNGSYSSTAFTDTLWAKTKNFTLGLMSHASYSLGSLIYTAWVQAGSPVFFPNAIEEIQDVSQIRFVQSFPNPFRKSTIISLESPGVHTSVTLEVYDCRGILIDTLLNQTIPQGRFEITWKPDELDTGVYYCVMKSGGKTSTLKMVLVR